ncbi:hypothetical protein BD408DRAFT_54022 [Parasitella parasitica]|nr:hypothetical protein BD408DRAFT_54022 [Parasitella parasitica]
MVVSLKNDQVITANVSKQAVKIIGNAEKLNANLLSNLKNEFTSLVQEALRTSRIKTKLPEPSAIDFDAEWEHFKKNSQNFSEDNQGAITFLFKHSLENLITTAQESGKLLQPIKDALNSIEKIDRKGNKLVVLNDLGYFSGYINNKVNILSPKSSQSHETALKVVVEVNECLQSTKKNYDHLCGELWKEQNCGTNYDAVKKEHDRATQEYENAQKRYEEVTKKEKDTWTNSFTVIETDSLMKGVCVACKPMVSDVPASVGERTFGTKEILSLDESDEKIISIDFGTDRSKFVVYEKKDGEWIRQVDFVL